MVWSSLWFVTGQNTVFNYQVYDLLLIKTLCYDQVYDLLLVRTLYATIRFMIWHRSEHCMLWPSLLLCSYCIIPSVWFVTGQNTVWHDQVYDLLLVRTLYVTAKFMMCYWSECHMLRQVIVTYKLTAVFLLYSTKFMIWY